MGGVAAISLVPHPNILRTRRHTSTLVRIQIETLNGVVRIVIAGDLAAAVHVNACLVLAYGVNPSCYLGTGKRGIDVVGACIFGIVEVGEDVGEQGSNGAHFLRQSEFGQTVAVAKQTGIQPHEQILRIAVSQKIIGKRHSQHLIEIVTEIVADAAD